MKYKELKVYAKTLSEQYDIISKLRDYLLTDPYFYFLHEGGFVVIRTTEDKMLDLARYFTLHIDLPVGKYSFEMQDYEEWNDTVKESIEEFTKIMHEASVISLKKKAGSALYERLTHCIFNIFDEGIRSSSKNSGYNLEADVLARLLIDRSFTAGLYYGKTVTDEEMKSWGF